MVIAGTKPHYLIGNLPHPSIINNRAVVHMAYCFAYIMSQEGLVYNHHTCDEAHWTWYGTEGFLGHGYMPGTKRGW